MIAKENKNGYSMAFTYHAIYLDKVPCTMLDFLDHINILF